jgi:hypothetical protein
MNAPMPSRLPCAGCGEPFRPRRTWHLLCGRCYRWRLIYGHISQTKRLLIEAEERPK